MNNVDKLLSDIIILARECSKRQIAEILDIPRSQVNKICKEHQLKPPNDSWLSDDLYAYYKGDTLVCIGTIQEIARCTGKSLETTFYYTTPAYRAKLERRGNPVGVIRMMKIEDEGESEKGA